MVKVLCTVFTGNDFFRGGDEVMVITKIKMFVQRWCRATIRVVEIDRGVFMTKLNINAGNI